MSDAATPPESDPDVRGADVTGLLTLESATTGGVAGPIGLLAGLVLGWLAGRFARRRT